MKNLSTLLSAVLAFCTLSAFSAFAQPNLLINGNFDTQYASGAPTRTHNIKNTSASYSDELPNWMTTTDVISYNAATSYNEASYVATNAAAIYPINPTVDLDPYTPYSGVGSVLLLGDHSHLFDGIITQQVSLTAGHSYVFSYYVRRLAYSDQIAKLAFNIVYSSSVPGHNADPSVNDLVPTPSIRRPSDFITQDQWVQVSGSFIAPTTSSDAWVTLGFDNSMPQTGSGLPAPVDGGVTNSIHLVLDDVSLVDIGCQIPPATPAITGNSSVCYNRTQDGSDIGRLKISTPAPEGLFYHGELISNRTGQVVEPDLDSRVGGTFGFLFNGGNYAVGQYTLRVRLTNSICGTAGTWTSRGINIANCSGSGCTTRDCGSLTQVAYPNPATDDLTVTTDGQEGKAVFYDAQGMAHKSINLHVDNTQTTINVRDLPAGVYHLCITRKNGTPIDKQIVIQH